MYKNCCLSAANAIKINLDFDLIILQQLILPSQQTWNQCVGGGGIFFAILSAQPQPLS